MAPPRVLLFGYSGANNTGSEARLLAAIEDVRAVLGPSAPITIPTLNQARQSRYVRADPHLRTEPYSTRSVLKLGRLVWKHDVVLLVEGSCYMDTWASALLLVYLWASFCARVLNRRCVAYCVDSGHLTPGNQKRVRREVNKTDLVITRTQAAADRLRSWGVTAPIEVTADLALSLDMDPSHADLLARIWPEAAGGVVGMALVDFYRWPVVFRPWGRSRDCYRWPFYFSSSEARRRASRELVERYAAEADRIVARHGRHVALLCMEELDTPVAHAVHRQMLHGDRARVFSSSEHDVSQMTAILRGLDALVSSRYHACALALAAGVPMVAVGHDLRIEDLFRELGLRDEFFIRFDSPELWARLSRCVDGLLSCPRAPRETILRGYQVLRQRAMRNREVLAGFVRRCGWR